MAKLRLGPVEDEKPVKLGVELSGPLHRELLRYAQVHAEETGLGHSLPIERLIPPMLERFMATDRAFLRRRRGAA